MGQSEPTQRLGKWIVETGALQSARYIERGGESWHRIGYSVPTHSCSSAGSAVSGDDALIADRQFALLIRLCAHRL
eukprot:6486602-Amphidinium_carterae.1